MRHFELALEVDGIYKTIEEHQGKTIMNACDKFREIKKKIDNKIFKVNEYSKIRLINRSFDNKETLSNVFVYHIFYTDDKNNEWYVNFQGHEIV